MDAVNGQCFNCVEDLREMGWHDIRRTTLPVLLLSLHWPLTLCVLCAVSCRKTVQSISLHVTSAAVDTRAISVTATVIDTVVVAVAAAAAAAADTDTAAAATGTSTSAVSLLLSLLLILSLSLSLFLL